MFKRYFNIGGEWRESSQSALDRIHGCVIYDLENCMSKPAQRLRSRPLYSHALSELYINAFTFLLFLALYVTFVQFY